jgi:hypothetical protein
MSAQDPYGLKGSFLDPDFKRQDVDLDQEIENMRKEADFLNKRATIPSEYRNPVSRRENQDAHFKIPGDAREA